MKRILTFMRPLPGKIARLPRVKGVKYELAPQADAKKLVPQLRKLMIAIATVLKEPKNLFVGSLITDEAYLYDFFFLHTRAQQKVCAEKLSKILKVKVDPKDRLVDIAKRL